jgi:tol-pal system protein YbgF
MDVMKIPRNAGAALVLLSLLAVSLPLCAEQAKLTTEQRLDRLERMLKNQNMADLVYQVQQLRQEVQRLNGELEMQKHAMDAMNRRQRDLYLDIDQRLGRLQSGPGGAVSAATPAAVTPPPAPVAPPVSVPTAPSPVPAQTAAAPAKPLDPKKEATAYQSAFNLLKQGRYPESIKAFRAFLNDYRGGSYEDNAKYWLAEASYVNRDFDTALKDFSKVIIDHPESSKVPGAMLKMGYIFYEQQAWDKAREVLQRLQNDYPGSTEARLGEKRLNRIAKEGH